jgi:uncharacterized damage-inducible protein DinB
MPHPLVLQLRFTRHEFIRGLEGLSDEDARRRILPANCISWNVGHLAWQEQRNWLYRGQERILLPEVQEQFAYGAPGTTPALADSLAAWKAITQETDPWLDTLTSEMLTQFFVAKGRTGGATFGSLLLRTIYHYWYHTGENMGIRQGLGHSNLPEFVGDIDAEAPYLPE